MWLKAVALVTAYLCVVCASDKKPRISGGTKAYENEFPFQVSIVSIDNRTSKEIFIHCGGFIISASWVLTAARCVQQPAHMMYLGYGSSFNSLPLIMGRVSSTYDMMIKRIAEKIVHEEFESTSEFVKNNIALLKVGSPFWMDGKKTAAAVLPDFDEKLPSSKGMIIGWGSSIPNREPRGELKKLEVFAYECNYTIGANIPKICAKGQHGGGVCQGDAGGPLIVGGKVFGMASMIAPEKQMYKKNWQCENDKLIGYYEAIAPQRKWIEKYTQV